MYKSVTCLEAQQNFLVSKTYYRNRSWCTHTLSTVPEVYMTPPTLAYFAYNQIYANARQFGVTLSSCTTKTIFNNKKKLAQQKFHGNRLDKTKSRKKICAKFGFDGVCVFGRQQWLNSYASNKKDNPKNMPRVYETKVGKAVSTFSGGKAQKTRPTNGKTTYWATGLFEYEDYSLSQSSLVVDISAQCYELINDSFQFSICFAMGINMQQSIVIGYTPVMHLEHISDVK